MVPSLMDIDNSTEKYIYQIKMLKRAKIFKPEIFKREWRGKSALF